MLKKQKYIDDLKSNNGRLFPSWVLKNFKSYRLPEIFIKDNEDPCNRTKEGKLELKKYQEFLAKYLDYNSPYKDILIYHSLGSGKTVTAINIYNMLYNYSPAWNVFILLKATLKNHPWLSDLSVWLQKNEEEYRMKNIIFISYDSPIADKQFLEAVKSSDTSKKSLYIIDEAHNFIRNVYSNINSRQGKRAQVIYDYIINDKKENAGVRVILLSGTPAINTPYELALLFNLLRPGIFPKSESQFNQIYVSSSGYKKINDASKNTFQRRIMGLVSYYIGATPDLYASKTIHYIDVPMSNYQTEIYTYFEEVEAGIARRHRIQQQGSETYMTYTRQASNFVFPQINQRITGELRPRPGKFKLNETDAKLIIEGSNKLKLEQGSAKSIATQNYLNELNNFINAFNEYLARKQEEDEKNGYTLQDDIKKYHDIYQNNYKEFQNKEKNKSSLYDALYRSSPKILYIIFNILKSPGPVLVYSNYVLVEGLQIFKIYLNYFGFTDYTGDLDQGKDGFRYTEYLGGINEKERARNLHVFNEKANKYGKDIKIILISPAGSEGISLRNVRQVHIMEPYWHEVRILQMVGRAIRYCSHSDLPVDERHVDIYRYISVRQDNQKMTTDQYIENLARSKEGLIQSFLDTMKEVAIDCGLDKTHNMMVQEYKCFQFDEPSLFEEYIGPAYKEDIYDDLKINNGSNNPDSITIKIKVMKIKAVIQLTPGTATGEAKYSESKFYWYNNEYGTVYDYDLYYAIGKVALDEDDIPKRLNKDTYIIDKLIPIPVLND